MNYTLLHLKHPSAHATLALLQAHFSTLAQLSLAGRTVVPSPNGFRIR
jgi:hypothetical protein